MEKVAVFLAEDLVYFAKSTDRSAITFAARAVMRYSVCRRHVGRSSGLESLDLYQNRKMASNFHIFWSQYEGSNGQPWFFVTSDP